MEDLIHHLLRGLSRAVVLLHDEVAGELRGFHKGLVEEVIGDD